MRKESSWLETCEDEYKRGRVFVRGGEERGGEEKEQEGGGLGWFVNIFRGRGCHRPTDALL